MEEATVELHEASFAKEAYYFLSVKIGSGEVKRTQVSERSSSPVFSPNSITLSCESDSNTQVLLPLEIQAFVIPNNSDDDDNSKTFSADDSTAVMLGSASIDLQAYRDSGTNTAMLVQFTRDLDDDNTQSLTLGSASIVLSLYKKAEVAPEITQQLESPVIPPTDSEEQVLGSSTEEERQDDEGSIVDIEEENNIVNDNLEKETATPEDLTQEEASEPLQDENVSPVAVIIPNRPFTATKSTDHVEVCIRFGQQVQRLVSQTEDLLSVSVVASVGKNTISSLSPVAVYAGGTVEEGFEPEVYENNLSPFNSTRYVSDEADPTWNEVLLLSVPETRDNTALRLDLVQVSSMSQCSYLMFYWIIPLSYFKINQEHSLCLPADPSWMDYTSSLTLSVFRRENINAEIRNAAAAEENSATAHKLEVTVKEISSSSAEGSLEQITNAVVAVESLSSAEIDSRVAEVEAQEPASFSVMSPFPLVSVLPDGTPRYNDSQPPIRTTPEGKSSTAASSIIKWDFPMLLTPPESNTNLLFRLFRRKLYEEYECIAYAIVDSSSSLSEVVMTTLSTEEFTNPIMLKLSLRKWSPSEFANFLRSSEKTSITRTNRNKMENHELQWMGAILRGLNRHPVVSIADKAGVHRVIYQEAKGATEPPSRESRRGSSTVPALLKEVSRLKVAKAAIEGQLAAKVGAEAMSKTRVKQYEEDHKALASQIESLQKEVGNKQSIIDRLLNEVDRRTLGIKNCGVQMVDLRKANVALKQELTLVKKQYQELKQREDQAEARIAEALRKNQSENTAPNRALTEQFTRLSESYKHLQEVNKELNNQASLVEEIQGENHDIKKSFARLEKAHAVQASYMQSLQAENQKILEYKTTVKTQERVIKHMERLIETKLAEIKGGNLMSGSGPNVHAEIHKLRLENKKLRSGGANLESNNNNESDNSSSTSEASAARCRALEEQLEATAKAAATEISELKVKIFEMEMGLGDDNDDDIEED